MKVAGALETARRSPRQRIAAEASATRALRTHLVEEHGYPLSWIKAAGYWVKGKADTTEKFE